MMNILNNLISRWYILVALYGLWLLAGQFWNQFESIKEIKETQSHKTQETELIQTLDSIREDEKHFNEKLARRVTEKTLNASLDTSSKTPYSNSAFTLFGDAEPEAKGIKSALPQEIREGITVSGIVNGKSAILVDAAGNKYIVSENDLFKDIRVISITESNVVLKDKLGTFSIAIK